jgi:plasmid stabilization system protein ParE
VAEVVFSARALASMRDVRRYLAERDPAAAARVIEAIERACALIGEYPWMGPAIPGTGLRRHVSRLYRYRVI